MAGLKLINIVILPTGVHRAFLFFPIFSWYTTLLEKELWTTVAVSNRSLVSPRALIISLLLFLSSAFLTACPFSLPPLPQSNSCGLGANAALHTQIWHRKQFAYYRSNLHCRPAVFCDRIACRDAVRRQRCSKAKKRDKWRCTGLVSSYWRMTTCVCELFSQFYSTF